VSPFRVALVVAVGASAAACSLSDAPAAPPRLVSKPGARATVPWIGTLAASKRPAVTARNGVTSIGVAATRTKAGRYRLRAVFPFSGTWRLRNRGGSLGAVRVRPAPPLASALPTARAFRLCGGAGPPYQQYALSFDPATNGLWTACRETRRLMRIEPATGEQRAILRVASTPYAIAAGLGAVWSAERSTTIYRLDTRTGRDTPAFDGTGFSYIWTAAGSVWAHDDEARRLMRYDPAGRRVVAQLATGDGASALVEDAGRIWIVNHRDGTLERIDAATNTLTRLAKLPGDAPERMALASGSLWVTGRGTDLLRVDPSTGAVLATIEIGAGGTDVRAAGGSIWVTAPTTEEDLRGNPFLDRLLRIDPATNTIVETIRPTARVVVTGTAVTGSTFWIADNERGRLYRLDPR
jgi:streptogramin lyase